MLEHKKYRAAHDVPLHSIKVGLCCATSAPRENSPVFLDENLISESYVRLILPPFFDQLTDNEKPYGHSMQDIARENTEKILWMF